MDGGYLDLDKILPLDTELEETKNYIKSQIISDLDILTSKEKSEESIGQKIWRKL